MILVHMRVDVELVDDMIESHGHQESESLFRVSHMVALPNQEPDTKDGLSETELTIGRALTAIQVNLQRRLAVERAALKALEDHGKSQA